MPSRICWRYYTDGNNADTQQLTDALVPVTVWTPDPLSHVLATCNDPG